MTPRVSIGVPVYNGESYLAEALDSLLAQTFSDFEIVVSDNASSDGTEELCRRYAAADGRMRYLRQGRNVGAARNYNVVFEESRGELFKWAAHDDVIAPTFLERTVEVMERETDVVACYPKTRYVDAAGALLRDTTEQLSVADSSVQRRVERLVDLSIAGDDVFMSIFGLFRSSALRRTQLIRAQCASDQLLLFELVLLGRLVEVPELLFLRRMHDGVSMVKNATPHAQQAWFDPDQKRRVVMPMWELWAVHREVLRASDLSSSDKRRCRWHLFRRFVRKWPALGGEIKKAAFQLFGRR
ncbi:MAG: glycosyltransferase family A protein [Planctomycetota bacterium]|nr:glycosyltransferase family A protein [Planctomycetota bacterium]